MSHLSRPVHLFVAYTFYAANDDRDAPTFGTRFEVIRWRSRDRQARGRVRVRPGYRMAPAAGAADITSPALREYWRGEQPAEPSSR